MWFLYVQAKKALRGHPLPAVLFVVHPARVEAQRLDERQSLLESCYPQCTMIGIPRVWSTLRLEGSRREANQLKE